MCNIELEGRERNELRRVKEKVKERERERKRGGKGKEGKLVG